MAVVVETVLFWVVTPCSLVGECRSSGTYRQVFRKLVIQNMILASGNGEQIVQRKMLFSGSQ
jgi:hypothetical protein